MFISINDFRIYEADQRQVILKLKDDVQYFRKNLNLHYNSTDFITLTSNYRDADVYASTTTAKKAIRTKIAIEKLSKLGYTPDDFDVIPYEKGDEFDMLKYTMKEDEHEDQDEKHFKTLDYVKTVGKYKTNPEDDFEKSFNKQLKKSGIIPQDLSTPEQGDSYIPRNKYKVMGVANAVEYKGKIYKLAFEQGRTDLPCFKVFDPNIKDKKGNFKEIAYQSIDQLPVELAEHPLFKIPYNYI